MKKNVLITGGTGYLGCVLTQTLLDEGIKELIKGHGVLLANNPYGND